MYHIGLDAGSVSVKLAVLDSQGGIMHGGYIRHRGRPLETALAALEDFLRQNPPSGDPFLSVTGSAGRIIGRALCIDTVNEVVAQAYATFKIYPHIRTIIELGGEDAKLITMGGGSPAVRDFSMNSVCAAGTGSFLDQQAERLRMSIEEFSELSLRSKNPPRIAGRCSVFAKSDMIHLQQIATPVEDIVAGLCFAVARNFKGSIARGRDILRPVAFHGGVAANKGMVRAFQEVLGLDDLFVPGEYALMGAIGAALKERDSDIARPFDIRGLQAFISSDKTREPGYAALATPGEDFFDRHSPKASLQIPAGSGRKTGYLGIDIGSISTNLAVIDDECRLLAKQYLMTAGRPIEAVRKGLDDIDKELGGMVEIAGVATTGSGRYMIADYVGADIVKNEITAQATAAAFIDKGVDTIFEIGGQDSKYISLRGGVISDFEMNKACAAGTGSFLEEQAEKLGISVKEEFARSAFAADNPCRLGERCTVFMENSLMSNLQRGADRQDLLAGLAYSIVQNYINRVVGKRPIGKKIFFQGGVAFNKSVVAAFEKYVGRPVTVPPDHEVTGAIGMALIARRHVNSLKTDHEPVRPPAERVPTRFKGFDLSKRSYDISSFECKGCPNVCEINRVQVEGEKGFLFYGGRCEKYDVRKKRTENSMPDLFRFREDMLWKEHLQRQISRGEVTSPVQSGKASPSRLTPHSSRGKIGIPYVFYFHDYLPFWTTLLWELGFQVEVSPRTDRHIVDLGQENVLSETCFPVKTAHGHIRYFLDRDVDAVFLPSFVNLNEGGNAFDRGFACPYTQTMPYAAKVAFRQLKFLAPVIDMGRGDRYIRKEIRTALAHYEVSAAEVGRAYEAARKAQDAYAEAVMDKGREVLARVDSRTVIVVGRPYNSFDKGMNLNIPAKLGGLGVLSLPMDFIPLEAGTISDAWPNMYWRAGQRILSAARFIRKHPHLYAVYIGNFSCGPDSFIIKFFDEEMTGKPYLHLEIDAHSADAGAITRCEAFLDSIENQTVTGEPCIVARPAKSGGVGITKRTVYIPRMSDHAFALAGAFQFCGVDAEVLPASTREAVDLGRKYVSGKECYPCAVTTGDMVKKMLEPGFDPSRSAFFMPSGSGPCRFGQYNVFHRLVLKECGYDDVPVFAPNQDENFYAHLGMVGKDFSLRSWRGVVAVELLQKSLHETRPYEKAAGTADALYEEYLEKTYQSVRGADGDLETLLRKARAAFAGIDTVRAERPLIGIVGEIFVRSNRFSNEDLVRRVEALGGEAYLAPVEEWLYYVNSMGLRKCLIKRDWSGIIKLLLKRFFQKRIEHGYCGLFEGALASLHEPDTAELMRLAGPYIHPSFEGEAILSIGKSIDLIHKGASGIINAMPFGCMPGTIVSGLMRGITADFGIPCLSVPFDGTESLTADIQLEAFMDQAEEYRKSRSV